MEAGTVEAVCLFLLVTSSALKQPHLTLSSDPRLRSWEKERHCPKSGVFSCRLALTELSATPRSQGLLYRDSAMVLQRIFRLSSVLRSAVSVHLKRNIGVTAVAFNKELDPVQKLFVDKIREYKSKRQASGGPVDIGPEYQQDLDRELYKLKQMYGKGEMDTFPTFKFDDPKFEVIDKPQS